MKYSVKFYQDCRILDDADEIIIKYKQRSIRLIDFVKKWENKRIVVDITELDDIDDNIEIFSAVYNETHNIAILLNSSQKIDKIIESGIPFFFKEGVRNLDDFMAQIKLGVSDIYLIGELCFNIEKFSKYCKEHNINLRIYPNVVQSISSFNTDNFTKFFIRPEDLELYEPYVDIVEFFGPLDKQPVLYNIYTEGRWAGDLNDVIIGLNINIDNKTIIPHFGIARLKCEKRCAFMKCDICSTVTDFSNTLVEKDLGLMKEKKNRYDKYKVNETVMSNDSASTIESDEEIFEEE